VLRFLVRETPSAEETESFILYFKKSHVKAESRVEDPD
jgi:hypothetical protein